MLNALLVSDIGKHAVKNANGRAVISRYLKSCLRHQRKQTESFKRDRLSSRVGTRDDNGVVSVTDRDINGNDLALCDKGMARAVELDHSVAVYFRLAGVHIRLAVFQFPWLFG